MDIFHMTQSDLAELRQVDVRTVPLDSLADIKAIRINAKMPGEQRMAEFFSQIKNPYCFKVGKIAVGISYSDDGVSLEQCLENYLQTL